MTYRTRPGAPATPDMLNAMTEAANVIDPYDGAGPVHPGEEPTI